MTLNTADLFDWDYGSHYTWGISDGDLGLLRLGGRDYLFGESEEDQLQTKIFAAVLALFLESGGYFFPWEGSPSVAGRGGGWQLIDNHLYIGPISSWNRIPQRQESMAAMQIWATRLYLYTSLAGMVANELSWGLHNPKAVETLAMYSVGRRNRNLSASRGWIWTEAEHPLYDPEGPISWEEIAKTNK